MVYYDNEYFSSPFFLNIGMGCICKTHLIPEEKLLFKYYKIYDKISAHASVV